MVNKKVPHQRDFFMLMGVLTIEKPARHTVEHVICLQGSTTNNQ